MNAVWAYGIAMAAMAIIDSIWLGVVAPAFYKAHIGHLLSAKPNMIAAVIFYLIYVFGITFFVVYPGLVNKTGLWQVLLGGAVLGLVAYATYDLTNQATLKDWPALVTIVDIIWGTLLTGTVAVASVWILRMFIHL